MNKYCLLISLLCCCLVSGVDDADIQHGAVTVAGERELIEEPVAHENSASASRSW